MKAMQRLVNSPTAAVDLFSNKQRLAEGLNVMGGTPLLGNLFRGIGETLQTASSKELQALKVDAARSVLKDASGGDSDNDVRMAISKFPAEARGLMEALAEISDVTVRAKQLEAEDVSAGKPRRSGYYNLARQELGLGEWSNSAGAANTPEGAMVLQPPVVGSGGGAVNWSDL
jgi:hypothetical protein